MKYHLLSILVLLIFSPSGESEVNGSVTLGPEGIVGPDIPAYYDYGTIADIGAELMAGVGVALGDVDGDGDADIVAAVSGKDIRYFENAGKNGTISYLDRGSVGDSEAVYGSGVSVALGDLNGDGDLDIITTSPQVGIKYFENIKNDTVVSFEDRGVIAKDTGWKYSGVGVALGDMDGDGDLDVMSFSPRSGVKYFEQVESDNETAFESRGAFVIPDADAKSYVGVRLGDIDNDGDLDIVTISSKGGIEGYNTLSNKPIPNMDYFGRLGDVGDGSEFAADLELADMDGDGDLDIVAFSSKTGVTYFEQVESELAPQFVERGVIGTPDAWENIGVGIDTGDVDGDGDIDIVTGTSKSQITLFRRKN